jgi:hypothetical protein
LSAGHGLDDSNGNELSKTPAEVDVSGKVSSKSDGADFGGVSDGQSLEDTPLLRLSVFVVASMNRRATYWDTAQDLSDKKCLDVLSSEEDCGETHEKDQTADDGVAVAEPLRDPTVDEETDDGANIGTVAQASLPGSGDFI